MNDTPGTPPPGASPSDEERNGAPGTSEPTSLSKGAPAPNPGWATEQPPPGSWDQGTPQQQPQQPQGTPHPPQGPTGPPQPPTQWGHQWAGPQQPGPPGHPGAYPPQYRPPAAKPGVIPLRPLGLGEILDGAITTMRKHWRSILPITVVVATVISAVMLVISRLNPAPTLDPETGLGPGEFGDSLGTSLLGGSVNYLVQFAGTAVVAAVITMVYSKAILGRKSTLGGAWRDARPRFLALLGLTGLLFLGAILVISVLMLPGLLLENVPLAVVGLLLSLGLCVWLGVLFSLAPSALMLEHATIRGALGRSRKLVTGSWWRILGINLLGSVIAGLIAVVVAIPVTIIGITLSFDGLDSLANGSAMTSWPMLIAVAIGNLVSLTISLPFTGGINVLLYVDQRIRREALDLELARAAGVQNYGAGGPLT
ncbi:hypothetical protein ACN20G_16215 [Streptomyces sp. BI20]|uniref:hypothetical protein n=1 Tax=Streptomyces sp. BI20 TaxID=3403460 RepID=UPI003C724BD9